MKKVLPIIISIAICLAVGFSASFFQADSIHSWYPVLAKPSITPPDIIFPIAWGIIYVLMGISAGLIWNRPNESRGDTIASFIVQLALNFLWSICFFYMMNPSLGFINIIALDIAAVIYTVLASRISRTAALLFVPYLLWLVFATYLNFYIMIHN